MELNGRQVTSHPKPLKQGYVYKELKHRILVEFVAGTEVIHLDMFSLVSMSRVTGSSVQSFAEAWMVKHIFTKNKYGNVRLE